MGEVWFAAANGGMGGGEVMLLHLAEAARTIGWRVGVLAPANPGDAAAAALAAGHEVVVLPNSGRRDYAWQLRRWRLRHRRHLLWCNGLLPGLATAGLPNRVLHLHRAVSPRGRIAVAAARLGARRVVVPSAFLARQIRGALVLPNWTSEFVQLPPPSPSRPLRVGFLGRLAPEKGILGLLQAIERLDAADPGSVRLVLGGEPTFTTPRERAELDDALAGLTGLVDRPGWLKPTEFFGRVDVAAFPSLGPESFGLVAAEAMACGIPFVISDAGALPEVVGPNHPYVVKAGDVDALAQAIMAATECPPSTIEAARMRWEAMFSPAAGLAALRGVLADLD